MRRRAAPSLLPPRIEILPRNRSPLLAKNPIETGVELDRETGETMLFVLISNFDFCKIRWIFENISFLIPKISMKVVRAVDN